MWRRRLAQLIVVLIALAIVALVAFATLRPFRIGALTLALVPELLGAGPQALSALTPTPTRISLSYGVARSDRLDLYLPEPPGSAAEPRPAVILVLGVNQVALDHPAVVRTAMALARIGLIVAVPADTELAAGRIGPGAPAHLVEAFQAVAARPEIDPEKVGLAGFSAGGSLALIAAADPAIAERVAYVNAFGAYADAATLLAEIGSRSVVIDGAARAWQPGELSRRASLELILGAISDETMRSLLRDKLAPVVTEGGPPPTFDPAFAARLDGDALVAYRLLTATSRSDADAALADLSAPAQAVLAALSPVTVAADIRAPVFLMHDVGDDAIPFADFEPLAAVIPAASLRRATAFEIFDHVQPDAGGIGLEQVPDLWNLFVHLRDVLDLAL